MARADKPLKFDANRIIGEHGLERGTSCKVLSHLTDVSGTLSEKDIEYLEPHRQALIDRGEYWNEEELKMFFLAHVFNCAQLRERKKIEIFFERTMTWEFNGKTERVACDCLVAKPFGVFAPQTPYFFLQEFKKQKQNEDAEGQMLLAMLMAQQENANGKPVYGCYLQGKFWVFTTLHDKDYCVSRAYDATQTEDLKAIIFMLRQLKAIILNELMD